MNAVVEVAREAPPEDGVMRPPLAPRGRPDPRPRCPRTATTISGHSREVLAPCKHIRRPAFADLPKTVPGTIRRSELPERTAPGDGSAAYWEETHR
ncbi:hypothetical protein [Streptomyces sp. NPDC059649]|uniref:hypothetical protein n=1 Tax=Streptomyces sp. NPDC059649 TaxID=3346895 RepID=UPI0036B7F032